MPKKAYLAEHLSSEELKDRYRSSQDSVETRKSAEHRRGKEPWLKEEQFQKFKEELKERPADGGIWTGPKVARCIEKETGREKVGNQRGWDYLKKSRYSCQKPRPKHKNGDPVEQ